MSRDWSKYVMESSSWLVLGPLLAAFSVLISGEIGNTESLIYLALFSLSVIGQQWWEKSLVVGATLSFFWTATLYFFQFPEIFGLESFLIWGSGASFLLAFLITSLGKSEAEYRLISQQRVNQKELHARKEVLETELSVKNQEIRATEQRLFEQQRLNAMLSKELEENRQSYQREISEKRAEAVEYQHQYQLAFAQVHTLKQQHETLSVEYEASAHAIEKLKEREGLFQQLEHSHSDLTKEQESLNQIIAHQFVKIEGFELEIESKNVKIEALEKELGALRELVDEQAKTHALLDQVTLDRDRLQNEVETRGSLSALERELNRVQGLHKQLQDQFEAKNCLLEETRKDLFLAQQAREALDIELREARLDGESEALRLLSEAHETIGKQAQEIEALETLVSTSLAAVK